MKQIYKYKAHKNIYYDITVLFLKAILNKINGHKQQRWKKICKITQQQLRMCVPTPHHNHFLICCIISTQMNPPHFNIYI